MTGIADTEAAATTAEKTTRDIYVCNECPIYAQSLLIQGEFITGFFSKTKLISGIFIVFFSFYFNY